MTGSRDGTCESSADLLKCIDARGRERFRGHWRARKRGERLENVFGSRAPVVGDANLRESDDASAIDDEGCGIGGFIRPVPAQAVREGERIVGIRRDAEV